eukprot:10748919-Ditylum_brightwellii.AAC.1
MAELHKIFKKKIGNLGEKREWDVHIVVEYLRFFEWIFHLYEEDKEERGHFDDEWPRRESTKDSGSSTDSSIKNWLSVEWLEHQFHEGSYTNALVKRYGETFGEDRISIINTHSGKNNQHSDYFIEDFFCNKVPRGHTTCNSWRNDHLHISSKEGEDIVTTANDAYDQIAIAAYNMGLVSGQYDTRAQVRERIKTYHEITMGFTPNDFPMECPDDLALETLLELSIEAEKTIVPNFFHESSKVDGKGSESDLREEFKRFKMEKLCDMVDTNKLFADATWTSFFDSLDNKGEGEGGVKTSA